MLAMPPKPMKRLEAKLEEDGSYTFSFVTPVKNAAQFKRIIEKEITACLGENDSITGANWETQSFTLITDDLRAIQLDLLKRMIIVKKV